MIVNLGVIDVPYANSADGTTTGDVANILEAKYGIMQHFVDDAMPDISAALARSYAGAVKSMMQGAPVNLDPFAGGASKIEGKFRDFLDANGTHIVTGAAKKRALTGKTLRKKKAPKDPIGPNKPVSFIDTGLYQASFKIWVE
jgi:hypothetical protein